jgi:circadian clock protein KaiB
MEDTEQPSDSSKQAQQDEDIYELRLYVAGNNRKSQLAFENLKEICYKYLAGKCYIEVIDLTKNPSLARVDHILAIPTLMRKNYPGKRIIGDLSNQEKVLEFLNLRISDLIGAVNEKGFVEKTSAEGSKAHIGGARGQKTIFSLTSAVIYASGYLKTWINGHFPCPISHINC